MPAPRVVGGDADGGLVQGRCFRELCGAPEGLSALGETPACDRQAALCPVPRSQSWLELGMTSEPSRQTGPGAGNPASSAKQAIPQGWGKLKYKISENRELPHHHHSSPDPGLQLSSLAQ